MAARRKPTTAEVEATEVPVVEVPETELEDVHADAPDAPAASGDRVLLDPEGDAHTIVAEGVQALLALGWTESE